MSAVTYDQVRVLYRTLLVFATVAAVILSLGLIQFVYFERPGEASGIQAHIVGVYQYDPNTGQTTGSDRSQFARSEQFAGVVDWTSIPGKVTTIAPSTDPRTRTVAVKVTPDLTDSGLTDGMLAQVQLTVDRPDPVQR